MHLAAASLPFMSLSYITFPSLALDQWYSPGLLIAGSQFKSRQERQENFLLQGQLPVLTLLSVSVPPLSYRSSTKKIPVILPKFQVACYS